MLLVPGSLLPLPQPQLGVGVALPGPQPSRGPQPLGADDDLLRDVLLPPDPVLQRGGHVGDREVEHHHHDGQGVLEHDHEQQPGEYSE